MPTIDEAIERAARALCRAQGLPEDYTGPGTCGDPSWKFKVNEAKAAISVFLSDVPVSEGMIEVGDSEEFAMNVETVMVGDRWLRIFKSMSAKLAEEIRDGQ